MRRSLQLIIVVVTLLGAGLQARADAAPPETEPTLSWVENANGPEVANDVVDDDPAIVARPVWQERVAAALADPDVAYLLLVLGFFGILFELASPGSVFPGAAGAIALLLAFFSLQLLPVSAGGVALLLLGFCLMIAESFAPSFGALAVGGVVALVVGSLALFDVDAPAVAVSRPLIGGVTIASAALLLAIGRLGLRARRRPVVSGREQMIGSTAIAASSFTGRGPVRLNGEIWTAQSEAPLQEGQAADVVDLQGLVLRVRPRRESSA